MQQVVAMTVPLLKTHGFNKRRHSFNRKTPGGLVHVLDFQMGPYMPPGTQELPPIRVNLYGKSTVNVGVFVPQLAPLVGRPTPKAWVNEYDCHLRHRIGELLPERADTWWELEDPALAGQTVHDAVDRYAIPWLDRITAADDIFAIYRAEGRLALGLPPAGPLYIGLLLLAEGNELAAEGTIRAYLSEDLHPNHRKYLAEFLPKVGLGHLVGESRRPHEVDRD